MQHFQILLPDAVYLQEKSPRTPEEQTELKGSAARASKACKPAQAVFQHFKELSKCCWVCSQNKYLPSYPSIYRSQVVLGCSFSFCKRFLENEREPKVLILTCH